MSELDYCYVCDEVRTFCSCTVDIDTSDVTDVLNYFRQRIAELEQENKALRRTVPHKLWEKHNALLERLEQLQRWNQVTQSYVVEQADDGLWVKWFDLYGVIKEARDE